MPSGFAQDPVSDRPGHLVLYDGVCGLCSRVVQFVLTHDDRAIFAFAALQSAAGMAMVKRFGGNPEELTTFYVVADYRTRQARMLSRSDAALFLAGTLGWPWRLASGLRVVPLAVRDWAYGVVAPHRYRVFGRREQCLIPRPEDRDRFID